VINLHWVAWFLDHQSFFANVPKHIPLVWRLADMAGFTGGCHYTQGCEKFIAKCGACPQLASNDEHDLSRQTWLRKKQSLGLIRPGMLHVVGTSRWIAAEARRSSLLGEFPITVIPNGLDVESFAPRDKMFARDLWSIPRDASVILFAAESTTNKRKGLSHLIDALKNIRGINKPFLLSVGSGKPPVDSSIPHLGLGRINDDRVLSAAYSAADVFVMPSLQESFGQTVTESLACGTPVVGFASGGIPDMVRPGVSGWLAPTGDTAALRDAIVGALNDPRRGEMSRECRRIAVQEYSLEVQARAYARLYESLLAQVPQSAAGADAGDADRLRRPLASSHRV
jgi:glycosyltransferase involved in cell wall biosynthesis